jgi:thiol-disulfide isomerase/thioredoxin
MQTAPTIHTTPSGHASDARRQAHAGWRAALAAALLWTAGAAAAGLPPLSHSLTPAAAGTPAPPIRLKDIEGRFHDLAALKGKVVLVNFWATWCPPCRREMPSMDRLARKLAGEDFVVLAVDVGEDADTVEAFLSQLDGGHAFPILLDTRGRTLQAWGGGGQPTTYLVDRQGRIAYTAVGGREFDHPEIERTVRELLASPTK